MPFKKTICLVIKFFVNEIKLLKINIVYFFVIFKEFKMICLLFEKFIPNKKFKTFRLDNINRFIELNHKSIKQKNYKSSKKIFVESFINHPVYTIQNCIIANNASRILERNCCGLLRKGDLRAKKIFNSFGINEIIYINEGNFLIRIINLVKAFKLLKNIKSIDKLMKLKIEKIEIGRSTYDQFLRFVKNPSIKDIRLDFYFLLAQAITYNNQFKKLFQKNKNTYLIQSETHYFPLSLCLSNAIKFGNKIISRRGEIAKIGLKIFSKKMNNYKENRNRPSKESFNLVRNKLKKSKISIKNNNEYFNLNIGKEVFQLIKKNDQKRNFKNKKEIIDYFNFDYQKPIVLILAHELSDGNLHNSWNLFKNDLLWLEETLKKIKDINNVNWIIKPHPSENIFNNKIKTKDIYNNYVKDKKNVSLFPDNYNIENFHKFISVAITSHGSAGFQYPLKSIPTIICGESTCSGFGFNIEPKTKVQYFNILKNISKIKKLSDKKIYNCFVFNYLFRYFSLEPLPITFETDISMNYDKKKFWKKTYTLTKKNGVFSKSFYDSMKFQILNNNSYYINLKRLHKLDNHYKS